MTRSYSRKYGCGCSIGKDVEDYNTPRRYGSGTRRYGDAKRGILKQQPKKVQIKSPKTSPVRKVSPRRRAIDKDLDKKYCDCVVKVAGKGSAYNPYAVCNTSVFHSRGLKGRRPECLIEYDFNDYTLAELKGFAKLRGIPGYSKMNKMQVVNALESMRAQKLSGKR